MTDRAKKCLLAFLVGLICSLLGSSLVLYWAHQFTTRIEFRCEGDTGIYYGVIRGDGFFAIENYDTNCTPPEPTYPGDSHLSGGMKT